MNFEGKIKALGLSPGGLDSILAGLLLRHQGIEVTWISFVTPFFSSEKAVKTSRETGIPLIIQNITATYLEMLKDPKTGYGKQMNPCRDCHALMFQLAGERLKESHYHFLFSGEVLGQRPMSQTKASLNYVENKSGWKGYILRPLSAKRLAVSIPEKKGCVNRDLLYDFEGRSRKPQMKLAETFRIKDYPAPAGGCLLTDKSYADRLKDLFLHQTKDLKERDLHLLKYGRHFRMSSKLKIIVGRNHEDNEGIRSCYLPQEDILMRPHQLPGASILIPYAYGTDQEAISVGALLCVSYSKQASCQPSAEVMVFTPTEHHIIPATSVSVDAYKKFQI